MNNQIKVIVPRHPIAKLNHLAKFKGRINMQQRKGRPCRIKRLAHQMEHDRRILADRIKHDWLFKFSHNFANDMNAF